MAYVDAIALLRTRREVRGSLAQEIDEVIKSVSQPAMPDELAELLTGSDREVIQTSQRLEKSFGRASAAHARSPSQVLGCRLRDLFTETLQRMKELPPDPREVLHANPAAVAVAAKPVKRRG